MISIFGVAENNLGETIANYLGEKHVVVAHRTKRIEEINAEDVQKSDTFILCNGYSYIDWIGEQDEKEVVKTLMENLGHTIIAVNNIAKYHRQFNREKTKIILIGSLAHKFVLNGSSAYCAAKAGIVHYARCAAYELAKYGITVHVINPGNIVGTPMTEKVIKDLERLHGFSAEQARAYWGKVDNLGEFVTMLDIAKIIESTLLNDQARWFSGALLDLPGSNR